MGFRILGTGSAVPDKILTNDDLSTMVETSDEWITTRVGVKERRIATTETTASLAAEAARRARDLIADEGGRVHRDDAGGALPHRVVVHQLFRACPAVPVHDLPFQDGDHGIAAAEGHDADPGEGQKELP